VKNAMRIVGAGVLAAAMFAVGGLGLFRGDASPTAPAAASRTDALLSSPGSSSGLGRTIATLQERLKADREDAAANATLGLAYLQIGRLTADPTYYPKAEGVLRRAISLDDAGFAAPLGMGALALARHDFAGALRWGRRALALNPYSGQVRAVIGDSLLELGRYDQAVRAFQRMIDLRPELSAYARVSYARELHGDVPGAIEAMTDALDAAGTPEDAAWAAYHLGELWWGIGDLERAERAYRIGSRYAPSHPLPAAGLAKVAAATGDLDGAVALLDDVVDRYPTAELVILLGDLHALAGDANGAEEQYELVRALQALSAENGVSTDLELALFEADHGTVDPSVVARARAEYLRRPSVQAADALAWTLHAAGRDAKAAPYAREALRLGTRSALFHFHAGIIALRLGDASGAREHLSSALELNPWFSFLHAAEARRALARLGGSPR